MAYWRHRTKSGRVVYDRPKNFFRPSDMKRIAGKLNVPYVSLPQSAFDLSFTPENGLLVDEMIDRIRSVYLLEGSVIPRMAEYYQWDPNTFIRDIFSAIFDRGYVLFARSSWIE